MSTPITHIGDNVILMHFILSQLSHDIVCIKFSVVHNFQFSLDIQFFANILREVGSML